MNYSIAARIPPGREKGNGKGEDRRGVREESDLRKNDMCPFELKLISAISNPNGGNRALSIGIRGQ